MKIYKRNFALLILFSLLLALFLTSCSGAAPTSEGSSITDVQITIAPAKTATATYAFRASKPGFATISGQLLVLSPSVLLPHADDAIFLVPLDSSQTVSTIPQFEIGKVPQADVDEANGNFVFTDIAPGTYAVVVLSTSQAQIPAHYYDKSEMAIITIGEKDLNQTMDIGKLAIP